MNKNELIDHVAGEADLPKTTAAAAIDAVVSGISLALKQGDEVRLVGFGTFSVKDRAAGVGRNPSTGKEIQIAASKSARFKPGLALKTALNPKEEPAAAPAPAAKPKAKKAK
jgi:DNA-binding protein HU-beta